ncbi:MAG: hypothetical protein HQ513_13105 [Rhodospirillales bacterium]|nr:hypothetical protein [Rhodospirillales bacterium]
MNETLLNTPNEEISSAPAEVSDEVQAMRPDDVPEKFWDQENATVRVEAMAKSYQELERKLGGAEVSPIPGSGTDYEVTIDGKPYETDADANQRVHAAGLNQSQVQTVYELANEKLMPALAGMAGDLQANSESERLKTHFGGEKNWNEARRQIAAWGRENFSDDVFGVLSNTYEGVLTMQRMMESKEPGLGKASPIGHGPNEGALKAMMGDPRYWRDNDPAYIERVRQGFRSLYPENQE